MYVGESLHSQINRNTHQRCGYKVQIEQKIEHHNHSKHCCKEIMNIYIHDTKKALSENYNYLFYSQTYLMGMVQ